MPQSEVHQPLDHTKKPGPCYAPVYAAAMYPDLVAIFREHGYALAVHGSLRRDLDLVAIPWIDTPSSHEAVLQEVMTQFAGELPDPIPGKKPHGRLAYTIIIGFGYCAIDISFTPTLHTELPDVA